MVSVPGTLRTGEQGIIRYLLCLQYFRLPESSRTMSSNAIAHFTSNNTSRAIVQKAFLISLCLSAIALPALSQSPATINACVSNPAGKH